MKALLGRKVGMTQILDEDGNAHAVTLIQAGPCHVTQIKNTERDGYEAMQLGFESNKRPKKPQLENTKKAKLDSTPRILREVRGVKPSEELTTGTKLSVDVFKIGDEVDITGISKGKGFAGTIKRWNFSRGPKTHGSMNYRKPGSIGSMYPQKIFRGKKMAGRMGGKRVTVVDQEIMIVDMENNLLGVKGVVPGARKSLVMVKESK